MKLVDDGCDCGDGYGSSGDVHVNDATKYVTFGLFDPCSFGSDVCPEVGNFPKVIPGL